MIPIYSKASKEPPKFRDERGAREVVHSAGKDARRDVDAKHAKEQLRDVKRDADDPHRYAK